MKGILGVFDKVRSVKHSILWAGSQHRRMEQTHIAMCMEHAVGPPGLGAEWKSDLSQNSTSSPCVSTYLAGLDLDL